MGIATTAMIAAWLTVGTVNMVGSSDGTEAELARMTAQVQALKADAHALKGSVATTAQRIEARQKFLDALLTNHGRGTQLVGLDDLLPRSGNISSGGAAASGVIAPFAILEAQQLALVDKAAATASTRIKDAEVLIGQLGLSPTRFVKQSMARVATGGPYIPATDLADKDAQGADPRFQELFVNWQRVEQLEVAMQSIPAFVPVKNYTMTSSYGVRHDPFSGRAANHGGLDMAAATGEPVMAAANGKVTRAGWFGAYGYCIDIDHGRGIVTRYAHLSKMTVKAGQKVSMGQRIGAVGSTGRSTGPHLHYEVRIDNKPLNPRRFIEASSYILAYQKEKVGPQLAAADIASN